MNPSTATPESPKPTPGSRVFNLRPTSSSGPLPAIDSATDLLADDKLKPLKELVHGLLHRETKGVLAGSSKAGKTWLLMDLAVSVACGTPFLRWPTTQGRVLYVNLEIHRAFFKSRLQTLLDKKGATNSENLNIWTLRGQNTQAATFLPDLANKVKSDGYSLIILDPMYKLMVGQAENSSTGVGNVCHDIEKLMEKTGATVVYAHHFTKGNQAAKKPMDRMSGSGVFARDADTTIMLTEHQEEGCFTVDTKLRNILSPQPFVVEWDYPLMVPRDDLDPRDLQRGETKDGNTKADFILSVLADQPLSSKEWEDKSEAGGIARSTFFRIKKDLVASGEVIFDPKTKKWTLPGRQASPQEGDIIDAEIVPDVPPEVSRETRETETTRPVLVLPPPAPAEGG